MKNVLVALDFEENSEKLIGVAAEIAEKFDCTIWLLHIAAPEPDFVGYDVGPQYIRDSRAEELREEHELLQRFSSRLKEKNIQAEGLLVQGPTMEMLMQEAAKLHIDLIVAGHHEHGFFYKAFVGSVADEIFKKAKLPLLFVPLD